MIELLYGTGNPAKLDSMRRALVGLPVRVISPAELSIPMPAISESGATPQENARIKAEACFRTYGRPVFACDSGLYFEGLPDELQPGVHVRRVGGRELNDDEMTIHYAALARRYGPLRASYKNAVCFVADRARRFERMSDDLAGGHFLLVDTPHPQRQPGFPLDCLSVEPHSGRYYYDLGAYQTDDNAQSQGFCRFFATTLQALHWL